MGQNAPYNAKDTIGNLQSSNIIYDIHNSLSGYCVTISTNCHRPNQFQSYNKFQRIMSLSAARSLIPSLLIFFFLISTASTLSIAIPFVASTIVTILLYAL